MLRWLSQFLPSAELSQRGRVKQFPIGMQTSDFDAKDTETPVLAEPSRKNNSRKREADRFARCEEGRKGFDLKVWSKEGAEEEEDKGGG
ncbi:hypothetical protein EOD39_16745 [Acipenser ruthenus]|uniref:Uncharacterized protein n=1 Tax=Acipenser ruthenus TaxID=7906 RepID=A0A444U8Y2_ACIRT|nr:hypothetical protein EOD39_16745 [Acipenser ruthenus]